jgi:CDP-ribitol ribitolphosphotransferase
MGRRENIAGTARGAAHAALKSVVLRGLFPGRYRIFSKEPIIPGSVVFLEVRGKTLSEDFGLLWAGLKRREGYSLHFASIEEGMASYPVYLRKCLAAIPNLARAEFVFVSESSYFLSALPIRKETTVLQVWHGPGAFKKFGYSTLGKGFGTSLQDLERFPLHKNFSYVTVSGPEVIGAYAEAFHMEDRQEDILPIGISRTDRFFSEKIRETALKRVTACLPDLPPGKKILLYAPTFRGKVASAKAPEAMDLWEMRREMRDEAVLLIRQHPFVKQRMEIPEELSDFALEAPAEIPTGDLLMAADLLITDYSSLIFEYALLERPMIFFAFDLQDYEKQRGFYYPLSELMPGIVLSSMRQLIPGIRSALKEFDRAKIRAFRKKFMSACDGHATERILDLCDRIREEKRL